MKKFAKLSEIAKAEESLKELCAKEQVETNGGASIIPFLIIMYSYPLPFPQWPFIG